MVWINKDGTKSEYYECSKCGHKHYDLSNMTTTIMIRYKSKPVHMFCICGKDLGKFG